MKHATRFLAPLALGVALAGCAAMKPQIFHSQLVQLDKGLPASDVPRRLGQPPVLEHHAQADGREFLFQQYRLNNGLQLDRYLVASENGRVVYWGYVSEFRRHPDASLGKALNTVLPAVMAQD